MGKKHSKKKKHRAMSRDEYQAMNESRLVMALTEPHLIMLTTDQAVTAVEGFIDGANNVSDAEWLDGIGTIIDKWRAYLNRGVQPVKVKEALKVLARTSPSPHKSKSTTPGADALGDLIMMQQKVFCFQGGKHRYRILGRSTSGLTLVCRDCGSPCTWKGDL